LELLGRFTFLISSIISPTCIEEISKALDKEDRLGLIGIAGEAKGSRSSERARSRYKYIESARKAC